MAHFIDLFSPETYEAFARSPRNTSGFRPRHKNVAEKIKPGDIFVCYLTRLSRWFGLLEVIVRAFEVEHTTSVYSGILRMADLLALPPNMDIKLHIVAPEVKRDKVFQEIRRPVFSLLEKALSQKAVLTFHTTVFVNWRRRSTCRICQTPCLTNMRRKPSDTRLMAWTSPVMKPTLGWTMLSRDEMRQAERLASGEQETRDEIGLAFQSYIAGIF
jgi:hypothetical protein